MYTARTQNIVFIQTEAFAQYTYHFYERSNNEKQPRFQYGTISNLDYQLGTINYLSNKTGANGPLMCLLPHTDVRHALCRKSNNKIKGE